MGRAQRNPSIDDSHNADGFRCALPILRSNMKIEEWRSTKLDFIHFWKSRF